MPPSQVDAAVKTSRHPLFFGRLTQIHEVPSIPLIVSDEANSTSANVRQIGWPAGLEGVWW